MNRKIMFNLALIAVAGSFGGLIAVYDMGIISSAQIFISKYWNLSPETLGMLVGAAMCGCLLGVIINGMIADKLGRKKILGLIAIIYLCGAFLCSQSIAIEMLIASRILNGIACGMANFIVPIYLSEIAPQKTRGFFVSLYQLSFTIGILVAYLVGYLFSSVENWRGMFLTGLIPAAVLLISFLFLSESPRWLILKGRDEEAKTVFEKIEDENLIQQRMDEIKETMKNDNQNEKVSLEKWMFLPVIIGIGIMFAQICTGINVIICYAPKIFQMAGFADASSAISISILIGVVNFLMTFVAMYLSDKVGRKPLLFSGAAIMGVSMIALAISFFYGEALGDAQKWIAVAAIIGFICSFAYSLGPVAWILVSEIFPLKVRGKLMTFPTAANFIFNIIILSCFPIMINKMGEAATFGLFGAICVASLVFIYFMVPETKGISLEKIEDNWREGVSPRKF